MTLIPVHAFPPAEYLRDELEERGWTEAEFSEMIPLPVETVSGILNAKDEITAESALAISATLGTAPEVWLSLQTRYRESQGLAS